MRIIVKHNAAEQGRRLTMIEREQIPYATAVALTRTAKRAQTKLKRNLPRRFTVRNAWTAKGIRIIPAKKKKPVATVYSRDDYMVRQEEGGIKKARDGGHIAIPGSGTRKSKRGIVTKAKRPRAMLEKTGVFIAPISSYGYVSTRSGGRERRRDERASYSAIEQRRKNLRAAKKRGAVLAIFQRYGRPRRATKGRYKGQKRQPIRMLFGLYHSAHVKERWGFNELVRSAVHREFAKEYREALERAIATAK